MKSDVFGRAHDRDAMGAVANQAILNASPDFLSIGGMFKSIRATEGDRRFVYLEASNESRDQQGEVVLQKALRESAGFFKQFGNIDLDHLSVIGARQGIPNYLSFEIGKPVDVRFDKGTTFVKALIYSGSGPAAEKANLFWSSLTDISPPKDWGASVGGAVLEKAIAVDPVSGEKYPVITKVRWTNIAASGQPVNPHLASVSTVPVGVLSKCWGTSGIDLRKSLQAGYGTDSSALTGGSALRTQSLDSVVVRKGLRTKRDVLTKAMAALKANRISGAEASELEDALNRGVSPRAAVIDRIFGESH